jgi:hypothetical protein
MSADPLRYSFFQGKSRRSLTQIKSGRPIRVEHGICARKRAYWRTAASPGAIISQYGR